MVEAKLRVYMNHEPYKVLLCRECFESFPSVKVVRET